MAFARISRLLTAFIFCGVLAVAEAVAADFDQSHALFTKVLARSVKDARVDYAALKADPKDLSRYMSQLAAVSRTDFKRWSESEQISFLINAYNAFTLQLIIDHYPVKSIKDIGSLIRGPWDQPSVRLFGETITLNTLEHKILRVDYAEPRLHYAVICAAVGCPPLRAEAFVGERLDEQLSDQARKFLATPSKNRIEAGEQTVYLSPIFKWYGGDFEKASGSVLAALSPFWPAGSVPTALGDYKIKYTDYDWSLNEQTR